MCWKAIWPYSDAMEGAPNMLQHRLSRLSPELQLQQQSQAFKAYIRLQHWKGQSLKSMDQCN
jgi:hypothetical protein